VRVSFRPIADIGIERSLGRVRLAFASAFLVLFLGHSSAVSAATEDCRWVEGRLSAYNGTPTFRIWPKGTKRLLGVIDRSGAGEGYEILPAKVARMQPSFSRDLWGSFRVCPQTPKRAGWMRMVVVTDARGLTAKKR
jgi:hypothetical protein